LKIEAAALRVLTCGLPFIFILTLFTFLFLLNVLALLVAFLFGFLPDLMFPPTFLNFVAFSAKSSFSSIIKFFSSSPMKL